MSKPKKEPFFWLTLQNNIELYIQKKSYQALSASPKIFLDLIGTPKIAQQDQKRAQKAPTWAVLETKNMRLYFQHQTQIKVLSLCKQIPKKFLVLTPTTKIAQKSPKNAKRPKIWPKEKQKHWAVLPRQKLIVYISRLQKYF